MLNDKLFKSLAHSFGKHKMFKNGQKLEMGYFPDYVLKDENDYIILESENSSNRKTFIGALFKAAHFLQKSRTGKLIFIIVPKKNTTAKSIAEHLTPYLKWISGRTNLQEVYVIEAKKYFPENKLIALDCSDFNKAAFKA